MELTKVLKKIPASLKSRGFVGTLVLGFESLRYRYRLHQEKAFDRQYGIDTTEKVLPEDFGVSCDNLKHAVRYEAITWDFFDRMMRVVPIDPQEYVFIDLGSGKGRALMFAANFPFRKIIGVEFSPKLHTIAEENIRRFKLKSGIEKDFELHCLPAEEYVFPQENTVLFLYNPFKAPVMAKVLSRLQQSLQGYPRKLIVLYRNPACSELLESQPFLRLVKGNSYYCVYVGQVEG